MERPRRAAAASVRFRPTSTASGGRGSVTTTSTSFPEARDGAAAPPPARSARVAAGASARGRRVRRKRRHGTRAVAVGARGRGYTVAPRGCGGIGRRARFRSVWEQSRGGSSPLIRIGGAGSDVRTGGQDPGCVFTPQTTGIPARWVTRPEVAGRAQGALTDRRRVNPPCRDAPDASPLLRIGRSPLSASTAEPAWVILRPRQ